MKREHNKSVPKEEPSINSLRGNTSSPTPQCPVAGTSVETHSSLLRPGRTATAQVEKPALSLFPMKKSLMEAVVDPANIERAWKQVKANRGAPGPDGITITKFPDWFRSRWSQIKQQLLDGTYRPGPVRRKTIDKPDGSGQRLLGIPNVIERLIQQAIVQVLTPIFDPQFSELSFGFRPKRSAHGAAKQVQRTIRRGYRYAADIDLSKFFDRRPTLMRRCPTRRLIGSYCSQSRRQSSAAAGRTLLASWRDGRRSSATHRGRSTRAPTGVSRVGRRSSQPDHE